MNHEPTTTQLAEYQTGQHSGLTVGLGESHQTKRAFMRTRSRLLPKSYYHHYCLRFTNYSTLRVDDLSFRGGDTGMKLVTRPIVQTFQWYGAVLG